MNQEQEKKKILIMEDDPFIARMYIKKLIKEGYTARQADNGIEGIDIMQTFLPDLVMLDIIMPQMDGFEVIRKLKDTKKFNKIPIVLLTNLGEKENIEKGLALGADDYIIKAHFTPEEAIARIKKILNKNE
ncbi:response regulator [bacterium]|nr:response regulator [bacterium]|tara:strand:- start:1396 stop:1788 length:393 start_codon:yes stop_codon:yes gene_type:complete